MVSGNRGSIPSSTTVDGIGGSGGTIAAGDAINHSAHFNPTPILQPPSNFFHPSSYSPPLNPNLNPNSIYNPIYDLDSNRDTKPIDDKINNEKLGVTIKNPKKRTRASRRAPTTVLTTDATNFRQMVQEFTGIPAAPFSGSPSSAFSRRSDLFSGLISPEVPVRPSANLNSATVTSGGFHIPPSETQGLTKQPLNLSNLQNQMFTFQSVPQTSILQQVNASEQDNQRSEHTSASPRSSLTSLKRWMGQDENMMNFEGVNGNNQNGVVSSRSDGDELAGDEDSWSF